MPELPVKEVRRTELHLPEIDRDEIVRSLSEIRFPAVDLSKLERPRIELPASTPRFDWRAIDLSGIDLGPVMAGVAALTRLGRSRARRSRWTVAAGLVVVAGLATAALLATPAVRERTGRAVRRVQTRLDTAGGTADRLDIDADVIADPGDPGAVDGPADTNLTEAASVIDEGVVADAGANGTSDLVEETAAS